MKPELKPDWENAPDWAEWRAQNSDGTWRWHEKKPETHVFINTMRDGWHYSLRRLGHWISHGKTSAAGNGSPNSDWRDTLERRSKYCVEVEPDLGDVLERIEKLCKHFNELNVTGSGFATTVTTTVPVDTIQTWSDGKMVCEITNIGDEK